MKAINIKFHAQPIRRKIIGNMPFDLVCCDVSGYDRSKHATGFEQLGHTFVGRLDWLVEYETNNGKTFLR